MILPVFKCLRGRFLISLALILSLWITSLPASAESEGLTLNLKDADILAVISTISEMTGKNFIIDPRVKGKVTIISSQPMNADAIYQVFLALLNVHGFAAVPGDGAIKIVPSVSAKQGPVPTITPRLQLTGDEYITRVIPVQNVNAAQLVPILRPLLPQQGHLAAYQNGNVLIASDIASNIDRLVQIIRRIDREGDEDIEVVRLSHASAAEVVRILKSLERGGEKGVPSDQPTLVADERTNSVLISGSKAQRLRLRTLVTHLDTPLETIGNTEVIYLRYANAKDLVSVLTGISKGLTEPQAAAAKGATSKRLDAFIEADEGSNSLVITASPDVLRSLKAVVRKLDIRRAQIMIEAVIAEVSEDTANELGVQWALGGEDGDLKGGGVVNFSGSGTGIIEIASALDNRTPIALDGLSVGIAAGDPFSIGAVLRALAGNANNNVLATPNLMTMDNEEAEIIVGREVPYLTGSYTSTGGGTTPENPFQTFERKDVGLTLRVKPQINEGDAVKLEITQEQSSIDAATTGAGDLVTRKRSIKTTVMVDDGQTIALGGLIDDQLREGEQKVPLLGDIPLLGALFRYRKTETVKSNLMIFLQPQILRTAEENYAVASEKYSLIRSRQQEARAKGAFLVPDDAVPLLPEWGQPLTQKAESIYKEKGNKAAEGKAESEGKRKTRNYWDEEDGF
jgi:general secretion pathway protein D